MQVVAVVRANEASKKLHPCGCVDRSKCLLSAYTAAARGCRWLTHIDTCNWWRDSAIAAPRASAATCWYSCRRASVTLAQTARPFIGLQNRATTTLSFKRLGTLDSNVSGLSSRRSASQQCGRPSVSVHSMEQSRSLVPRIAIVVPSQRIDRCPRRRRQTEAATPASSPTRRQQPGGHG